MRPEKGKWGVIFDMDGVLVDSYDAHFLSWKRMLENRGLNITEEQFSSTFGQTNKDIISMLFPSIKLDEYEPMAQEKEKIFRDIIREDFPEMEGASELIKAIHDAGGSLGIGSSGPLENIKTVLQLLGAGGYFRAIVSETEIIHGKPHPEVFLKTAQKLGLAPRMCVVIEDAPSGVEAAKRAGCAVVGLTGTVSRERLNQADMVVDSLKELNLVILKGLIKC